MKRKMAWIGIPWIAGLFIAAACRNKMTVWLLLAAWMLLGAFRFLRSLTTGQMLCVGISLTVAMGTVVAYTALVYRPIVAHDGTATTFSGRVTAAAVYDGDWAAYQVKGMFADGTRAKVLVFTEDLGAAYGDQLDVAGSFSVMEDSYLFQTASNYRAKGIFLQADSDALVTRTASESGRLIRALQQYRERISVRICTLAGTDAGGMVSAMLLGTKETLDDTVKSAFLHSGVSHVLSVSGLHLVLLFSVWLWLAKRLRLRRYAAFAGSVIGVILYALLVGSPVSVLRAGLMFLLVQGAPLLYRRADSLSSLCLAGVLLTLRNPYAVLDASFLLSMTGTFGIAILAPWMTKHIRRKTPCVRLLRSFLAAVCVSVCTFPVTLLYYREISVLSPVANILLVPIASLMLLLSLAIFLTGGIGIVAKPVCFVLHLLYDVLMLLARGLQRLVPVTFPTGWELLGALSCLLVFFVLCVFFFRRKPRAVALATAASFALLLAGQTVYRLGERSCFLLTVFGRDDNAVAVISYQGKTDVIDLTGHHRNADYVEAYLEEYGITHLNSICLTKRSAQLRVTYQDALENCTAEEAVVSADCWLPESTDLLGAAVQKADAFTLADTAYTVTYADGLVQIEYGTLRFCVGTQQSALPDGEWDAVICTAWNGDASEPVPSSVYVKEEYLQLRVKPNGTWTVET